ncbi:hypothetical protein C6357_28630 [Bacillus wiedmannii]|uniref:Uncharacterized protein n=1 Tax=Bacillus wiedmannii TaxID=1890302 RepID=A0ABX5DNV1_9BACI|nr:hypothetical protein C6357_28630 [Bacillus wiedmannii]
MKIEGEKITKIGKYRYREKGKYPYIYKWEKGNREIGILFKRRVNSLFTNKKACCNVIHNKHHSTKQNIF